MGDPNRRMFSPEIEAMPREDIDRLQEEKLLGDLVPWAYERSGLIRETWDAAGVKPADIQSLDDFHEKVPFIDKDAIRSYRDRHDDPYGGLLARPRRPEAARRLLGDLLDVGHDRRPHAGAVRRARPEHARARVLGGWARRPGDHFMHCLFTFRGPGIHETIRGIGATPVFVDHQPEDIGTLLRLSRELRPTGWYTMSGPLLHDDRAARGQAGDVDPVDTFSSYTGVIFAGEPIGPALVPARRELGARAVHPDEPGRRRRRDRVPRARRLPLLGGLRVRRDARPAGHRGGRRR